MKRMRRASALTRFALFLLTVLTNSALYTGIASAQPAPVPPEYQDLYTSLSGYMTTFNTTLNSMWNGTTYPVLMSATLVTANANSGPQLIASGHYTNTLLQVQAMQAMGVKAVMVEVGFPMLYEPFLTGQGQNYQDYVNFYQQLAAAVKATGMKLIVENNCLLSNDVQAGWNTAPFYATLDWTQYQAARAQTAVTIAQTMQPDYMVVLEEPDTEAWQSGQSNANTVSGSTSMLSQILAGLQQNPVAGVKVGAGVGSWLNGYLGFIQSYVTMPVDFIDMHIYPVNTTTNNNDYLTDALTIASTAAAAGKPITMTECWLNKIRDSELGVLTADQIRARDAFSFWEPLDAAFVQTIENIANYTQMTFMAPSDSDYYWAYQTYNTTLAGESPTQILNDETTLAQQAMDAASYTSTALGYYSSIVSPPDKTPPSTPANLAGGPTSSSTAALSWMPSTDNIGVAGYSVIRNGVSVAQTAPASFQDSGLAATTTYSYVVQAFDLAGNVSAPSLSFNVTTKDAGPPSPPYNLVATVVSTKQINLTWSPSTDINVKSYAIFQGTSPTALSQVGTTYSTTTSFSCYPLNPSTTYYFGVEAVDNSGYVSMSAIVSATTLALPSAPANVTATATSTTQIAVSWTPGHSGLPILSYQIYRGASATSLVQVATRTTTSFTDLSLTPSTKYYYAIQEMDSGGNLSPLSPTVSATTLALPSAPTNVTATANSATQIVVSWIPGPSGMPVWSYQIYRGTSASSLAQVATRTTTSYTDLSLTPGTKYYYAIREVATGGILSPLSTTVSVTTLALPSMPANVTATALSSKMVSVAWSASTGGLPVSSYHIYRGSSPSNMVNVATRTGTSYTDTSVAPATTYYYAVQAVDTKGELSPMSAAVPLTTPN